MGALRFVPAAEEELDRLYDHDEDAAALVDAWFEAVCEDERLLEILFRPQNHYARRPPFEVKRYEAMWRRGKNVFTVKIDDAGKPIGYRVLIGWHSQRDDYYILAVAPRSEAYELDDPLFDDIICRYEKAGIPAY